MLCVFGAEVFFVIIVIKGVNNFFPSRDNEISALWLILLLSCVEPSLYTTLNPRTQRCREMLEMPAMPLLHHLTEAGTKCLWLGSAEAAPPHSTALV